MFKKRNTCDLMFIAIQNSKNTKLTYVSINEWMKNTHAYTYIYVEEYYSEIQIMKF
jgi:hypothetical protein